MMPQILVCRPHSGLQDLSKPIHPHANLPQQTPRVLAHTSPCSPMSEGAHWAHLVQMAVQPIVDDGMEVFQAATMEGVDQVPFSFGLIKFGVGRVEVFNFKQEVRGRDRCVRGTSQLLDLFKLENMKRVTILFRKLVKCAAKMGQAQWHTPVISAIQEAEAGGSQFEASLRNLVRPCLTIKTKKGWEMQLSGKVPLGLSFQYQKKKKEYQVPLIMTIFLLVLNFYVQITNPCAQFCMHFWGPSQCQPPAMQMPIAFYVSS